MRKCKHVPAEMLRGRPKAGKTLVKGTETRRVLL